MLGEYNQTRLSEYSSLYDILVPKDNELRKIKEAIDFSFVREELKDKYSVDMGRKAEDPVRMFKYIMLKAINPCSDVDLVKRAFTDMSYKFFLGLNPEDSVIDPSLLSKFRRQRLVDTDLLNMLIDKTVRLAIDKGIINRKSDIIVDATHTVSCFKKYAPKVFMVKMSQKLVIACKPYLNADFSISDCIRPKEDRDMNEWKSYCESLIKTIKDQKKDKVPDIGQKLRYLEEGIEDLKYRDYISKDHDSRNGYKSATKPFNGYKNHIAMTPEGIVTGVVVTPGNKSDGDYLPALVEQTEKHGLEVDATIGDTAYCSKDNMEFCQDKIELVAPMNPVVSMGSRMLDDEKMKFVYDKDADACICPAGKLSQNKIYKPEVKKEKDENGKVIKKYKHAQYKFYFGATECRQCPLKEKCCKGGLRGRAYCITIHTDLDKEQMLFEESDIFKQKLRKRKRIEGLNGHLKNDLGLKETISYGQKSLEMQTAVAIFTSNMKKIVKLGQEKG